MSTLKDRYLTLKDQLSTLSAQAGRTEPVTLIAVSKFQPIDAIETLYELGQRDFGENYVQELIKKGQALKLKGMEDIRWHLIGHLQSNKVKLVLPWIHAIHTVDSVALARELSKRWLQLEAHRKLPIFLQVNLHLEASKGGFTPQELKSQIELIQPLPGLEIQGLMCIPDPEKNSQESFAALRELEMRCKPMTHGGLSMGMSQDYQEAIAEGASHIRMGTILFGERRKG